MTGGFWIPACAGMTGGFWIPACAGMTGGFWIPACAGMTGGFWIPAHTRRSRAHPSCPPLFVVPATPVIAATPVVPAQAGIQRRWLQVIEKTYCTIATLARGARRGFWVPAPTRRARPFPSLPPYPSFPRRRESSGNPEAMAPGDRASVLHNCDAGKGSETGVLGSRPHPSFPPPPVIPAQAGIQRGTPPPNPVHPCQFSNKYRKSTKAVGKVLTGRNGQVILLWLSLPPHR